MMENLGLFFDRRRWHRLCQPNSRTGGFWLARIAAMRQICSKAEPHWGMSDNVLKAAKPGDIPPELRLDILATALASAYELIA